MDRPAEVAPLEIPGGSPDPVAPSVALPDETVVELAGIFISGLDDSLKGSLRHRVARCPEAIRDEARSVVEASGLSEAQRKALANLSPLILKEWGIEDSASPTACAGLILAPAVLSWWRSAKALEALAERVP